MHSVGSDHQSQLEPVIRPATRADLEQFYEGRIPVSMRAHVLDVGGKILGVGGLYFESGYTVAFSHITDELRAHRKWIVKGARYLQRLIEQEPGTVLAVASPKEKTSEHLLQRLGFEQARQTPNGMLCVFRRN